MRVLAFAASLRRESFNRKLVELAARIARGQRAEVDLADFREFDMPLYNQDLDQAQGPPAGVLELNRRLERADALLLAAPEYNYAIAGPLKNAIDWVSRIRPMPWRCKSIYLMSASPSPMGGIRGLWQTRVPLEGCGAFVFPDMFALANAPGAFDAAGDLKDPQLAERLRTEIVGFLRLAESVGRVFKAPPTAKERERVASIEAAIEEESELQPAAK